MACEQDTIVALSSPPGAGSRGIVRLSGPQAVAIARSRLARAPALPAGAYACAAVSVKVPGFPGAVEGALYLMRAPRSYTREDVAEIHVPGSPALLSALLEACYGAGARPANPGEFTFRAFLNGRIELDQAEAVNRLIRARDEASRRASVRALDGVLSREAAQLSGLLTEALARTEARFDFADQDLEAEPPESILSLLATAREALGEVLSRGTGRADEGDPLVLLAGRPNAGKSSLFNALLGGDHALVSAHPGTTRDVVTGRFEAGGSSLVLADPAGAGGGKGPVEAKAERMFLRWLEGADRVVWVLDGSVAPGGAEADLEHRLAGRRVLRVVNKADLPSAWTADHRARWGGEALWVSAATGAGVDALASVLSDLVRGPDSGRSPEAFGLNARQRGAFSRAAAGVEAATEALGAGSEEIASLELREAIASLGGLSGRGLTEEVLGTIFSRFCVGK